MTFELARWSHIRDTCMARHRFYPFHERFSRSVSRGSGGWNQSGTKSRFLPISIYGGPTHESGPREQTRNKRRTWTRRWVKRLSRLSRLVINDVRLKTHDKRGRCRVLARARTDRSSPWYVSSEHLPEKMECHWAPPKLGRSWPNPDATRLLGYFN